MVKHKKGRLGYNNFHLPMIGHLVNRTAVTIKLTSEAIIKLTVFSRNDGVKLFAWLANS